MNNTEINKSPEAAPKLGVVAGSLPSSEEYFADRDAFVAYVLDEVNPARAAEGLSTVSHGAASRLYDIVKSGAYLHLENDQDQTRPPNTIKP
jgi:hypothetical protein